MLGFTSAAELQALPGQWSPLFDVCHYLLAALAIRSEVGLARSKAKPLATWLATMSASFAGSLLANPLLGKPVLAAMSNEYQVMLATIIWWGVFFSPGDLVYSISKNKMVYIPTCVIKEIYRAKKIVGGMGDARKLFPENEMIILMIGTLKGNGSGFMKPITRLIIGDWIPAKTEILKMSTTTKECFAASFFLLGHELGYISMISLDLLYITIITCFVLIKLSGVLAASIDPFEPIEQIISTLLLGGLWDNMGEDEEVVVQEEEVVVQEEEEVIVPDVETEAAEEGC